MKASEAARLWFVELSVLARSPRTLTACRAELGDTVEAIATIRGIPPLELEAVTRDLLVTSIDKYRTRRDARYHRHPHLAPKERSPASVARRIASSAATAAWTMVDWALRCPRALCTTARRGPSGAGARSRRRAGTGGARPGCLPDGRPGVCVREGGDAGRHALPRVVGVPAADRDEPSLARKMLAELSRRLRTVERSSTSRARGPALSLDVQTSVQWRCEPAGRPRPRPRRG